MVSDGAFNVRSDPATRPGNIVSKLQAGDTAGISAGPMCREHALVECQGLRRPDWLGQRRDGGRLLPGARVNA